LIVLNHESIRNASFSLLPTGYNPEEVDAALNQMAEGMAAGNEISEFAGSVSFEVTDVGYSPEEVDEFFSRVAAHATASDPQLSADEPAAEAAIPTSLEPEVTSGPITEGGAASDVAHEEEIDDPSASDESDDAHAQSPIAIVYQGLETGVLDFEILGQAINRTADTLSSLQGFIGNEVTAMKLAVERQAQETAKHCEVMLAQASADATTLTESVNEEIARARRAADQQLEKERRELAKELKQARSICDDEVAKARAEAEQYAADVRAAADADRAAAQRTIENAISMQSSIAESLERARQQLTPGEPVRDDIAA
jgi:hypothetical protein